MAANDEELMKIVRKRWRIGATLTALMMVAYFGFVLLVAFAPRFLGTWLGGASISVGIVIGASVIALAPVLTAIYVRWANRHYDPAVASIRKRAP